MLEDPGYRSQRLQGSRWRACPEAIPVGNGQRPWTWGRSRCGGAVFRACVTSRAASLQNDEPVNAAPIQVLTPTLTPGCVQSNLDQWKMSNMLGCLPRQPT